MGSVRPVRHPELRGTTAGLRESQQYLHDHQRELMGGAGRAIMSKVLENDKAAAALRVTSERNAARTAANEQPEFRPGGGVPA